jgi:hypothetical protein
MKKNTILQESWVWNNAVQEFVKPLIMGKSLNVCAGKSELGDIKLDLNPIDKSVLKGDMRGLPFENEVFDTVIQDPPWKIGYYERMRPFFECVRVCKVGGIIIYNATWIPESQSTKLIRTYVRQDNSFSNTSVISIHEKITNKFDNYKSNSLTK